MSKGTTSFGKKGKKSVHIRCRRCGRHSYHKRRGYCAQCGFGRTARLRNYAWAKRR